MTDDASAAALEVVRAGELSHSEAVRPALPEAAARRRLRSAVPARLGRSAGRLEARELRAVDEALMLVVGL